jgi:hypothetical protein
MLATSPAKYSRAFAKSRENVPIPHFRGGYVLTIRILNDILLLVTAMHVKNATLK